MSEHEAEYSVGRADPFLHLSFGWQTSGLISDASLEALATWAGRIGPSCDAAGIDIGPAGGRLRSWGEGPSEDMIGALAPFFVEAGATQDDLDFVTGVGSALDPKRFGSWVETRDDERVLGWHVARVVVGQLQAWLPWLDGLDRSADVRRWSRSVGSVESDTLDVVVDGTGSAAVAAATTVLAACGIDLPPDDALGALARHADEGVGVEIIAVGSSIVGGGITVTTSDVPAVVDVLHSLGCGEREIDRVARVRGATGEPAITAAGAVTRPTGIDGIVRLRLS